MCLLYILLPRVLNRWIRQIRQHLCTQTHSSDTHLTHLTPACRPFDTHLTHICHTGSISARVPVGVCPLYHGGTPLHEDHLHRPGARHSPNAGQRACQPGGLCRGRDCLPYCQKWPFSLCESPYCKSSERSHAWHIGALLEPRWCVHLLS